ncbi:MAG TPA: NrfD/PsrC family molybdoenzyme membrane anchor subunit [Anaerolineales bacterium]
MKTTEKILWGLGGIAFLVGLLGLVQRISTGHLQAGYGTYVPWGLWVGLYTLLIGMSAGSFLLASLGISFGIKRLEQVVRPALLVALATFVGGMLAVWLDLGHPLRAWRLYFSTGTSSVMGWMAWFYAMYLVLLLVLVWKVVWKKQPVDGVVRTLAAVGAFLAILFGGAEGALFGVVGARDFWHSGLTPILFLAEGALSGIALVTFFAALLQLVEVDVVRVLGRTVLGLLLVAALLEWAEISIGYYASIPAYTKSLALVLSGPFWWVFWLLHVGLGVAVPLVLLVFAGRVRWSVLVAAGLVALTALSTKLNLVITAQAVPEFEELRTAYTGPGLSFNYFPTNLEWLLGVWIVGVVALVALAGYRFLLLGPAPKAKPAAIKTKQEATV